MLDFVRQISRTKDWQSLGLLMVIVGVAVWLIVLPFSRSVQTTCLQRFHLATPSFVQWAIQQPVPSMYNFENRYWVAEHRLSAAELESLARNEQTADPSIKEPTNDGAKDGLPITKMANHFPARIFTFADSRYHYLENKDARFLYMRSRYRGNELISLFEVQTNKHEPVEDGLEQNGFNLIRREIPVE